jgi:homogentisate 1,2-dioxygenase
LLVPQVGRLRIASELGLLDLSPGEICVIPRGIKFRVELLENVARGYVCENYGTPFQLPELGPIGSNGLANSQDFLTPVAHFEDREGDYRIIAKFLGRLWDAPSHHSPLDVVGWRGNYAPYKYDLSNFNAINTVSFDHPDPSIFTVLTSVSAVPGTANVDFVIFPPRWVVAQHTFRPPPFHRNVMNEFMGLIRGTYDGKSEGFIPGGASLHNCMTGHGPDAPTYERGLADDLTPRRIDDTLAFMFETHLVMRPTRFALEAPIRQREYYKCWGELKKGFRGWSRDGR